MIVERHGGGCFGLDGKERKVSRGLGFFGRTHTLHSNTKGWCGAVRCGAVRWRYAYVQLLAANQRVKDRYF